jgi:putative ABC transport system permease protein
MTLYELWSDLRYRLRGIFRRDRVEAELHDELAFHVERETEKYVGQGIAPAEARRRALVAFGGVDRIKDDARDARGTMLLETTLQDLRYAARSLRAKPALTLGIVLTLALGIGANAAMFGIVDRLLFRVPAYLADASRTHRVYFSWWRDGRNTVSRNTQFARYLDVTRATTSFSAVAAFQTREMVVGQGADARNMLVGVVSGNYFEFFDAKPALGRFLTADDDRAPGGSPVAVLSYAFWQGSYAGNRDVVGTTLQLGNAACTIVGVAPPDFVGLGDEGIPIAFMPITTHAASLRSSTYTRIYTWSWLELMARRKPGVSLDSATADLTYALGLSWQAQIDALPETPSVASARPTARLEPVQLERGPQASANARVAAWVAAVAVIVLLIACANVANLLLSRAIARRREIAVRLALGVSRARLARQLLTETLLLSTLGSVVGLALAEWLGGALRAWFFSPGQKTPVLADGRTLAFAAAVTAAAAVATAVAPIVHARRDDVAETLKSGAYFGTARQSRTRAALLLVQTALSMVLLIGAGLFVRSVYNISALRLGYDVDPIVYVSRQFRTTRVTPAEDAALADRLVSAATSVPGVAAATPAVTVPFWSNEGRPIFVAGIENVRMLGRFILQSGSPDYFATMGTRILRGRGFIAADQPASMRVAVVSESMARVLWPERDALGQCLRIAEPDAPCTTIVGIAEDVRSRSVVDDREFMYFIPAAQYSWGAPSDMFVRVHGDAADYVDSLRRRLQPLMPGEAFVTVRPLRELTDPMRRSWQFGATMFVAFGALALVLAAIGLYSVMAYDVAQRAKEVGLRIALGASAARVVRLVISQRVGTVLGGIAAGLVVALAAARWVAALLFKVSPWDPLIFASVALTLVAVSLAASALPAIRAARMDPNRALRVE